MAQVLGQPGWGLLFSACSCVGGDIVHHSRGMANGSCLSFRHSREHPCLYVGREHRDHVRGTHPRCCRVQSLARAVVLLQEKVGRAGL